MPEPNPNSNLNLSKTMPKPNPNSNLKGILRDMEISHPPAMCRCGAIASGNSPFYSTNKEGPYPLHGYAHSDVNRRVYTFPT